MAESYKNLKVWQESMILAEDIYKTTKEFPKEEVFGITSQIRRSVVSVSSNISEGSGRSSKKEYARFIDISIGSLNETENLLELSLRLGYLNKVKYDKILDNINNIGKLLGAFRKYLLKISL